jgi:hypothetical protein
MWIPAKMGSAMASAPELNFRHPTVRFTALASPVGRSSLLKAAHRQTQSSIDALEATISGPIPDRSQLGRLRLRISQSDRARGQIATDVCRHLICTASPRCADRLRQLQRMQTEHFQIVTHHLRKWTAVTVLENWPSYAEAAGSMCGRIREIIGAEKALLYPLLKRDSKPLSKRGETD